MHLQAFGNQKPLECTEAVERAIIACAARSVNGFFPIFSCVWGDFVTSLAGERSRGCFFISVFGASPNEHSLSRKEFFITLIFHWKAGRFGIIYKR